VQPAARLPLWAKSAGAVVVEVNPHPTPLSEVADYSIRRGSSQFFSALCTALEAASR
jgi:NAD-dependent deacetylase